MRLDVYLHKTGLVESRSKAKELIERGLVKVDGNIVIKPSFDVENNQVELIDSLRFVSRAGEKLEAVINRFKIDVKDKLCLDVGASTGGFTHCLLLHGAKKVYAVDVGENQLHPSLKYDTRVVSLENTDIRDFSPGFLFEFASVDVSFISLKLVLPHVYRLLEEGGEVLALIKPQFEVGKGNVKRGLVKDKKLQKETVDGIVEFAMSLGFVFRGLMPSPVKGKKGNQEFLVYLKRCTKLLRY